MPLLGNVHKRPRFPERRVPPSLPPATALRPLFFPSLFFVIPALLRHPRESGDPVGSRAMPRTPWAPASAGMTKGRHTRCAGGFRCGERSAIAGHRASASALPLFMRRLGEKGSRRERRDRRGRRFAAKPRLWCPPSSSSGSASEAACGDGNPSLRSLRSLREIKSSAPPHEPPLTAPALPARSNTQGSSARPPPPRSPCRSACPSHARRASRCGSAAAWAQGSPPAAPRCT